MSTTNWGICPVCVNAAEKKLHKRKRQLGQDYGKVPVQEWIEKEKNIPDRINREDFRTLREDFDMGILVAENKFYAEYRAKCDRCNSEFNFNRYKNNPLS